MGEGKNPRHCERGENPVRWSGLPWRIKPRNDDLSDIEKSNLQNLQIPNSDKPVALYTLDVILAIGYRVKSPQPARFNSQIHTKWRL